MKQVLDVCCGSRMFWIDRSDNRAVFVDQRVESHVLPDVSSAGGSRTLIISPDIQADFTRLPFKSDYFAQVVFDPPHFDNVGPKSWIGKKYGKLSGDWPDMIRRGFIECFRVLAPNGTLIFKWCDYQIPLSKVIELSPISPLFGNNKPSNSKTHWLSFIKPADYNNTAASMATLPLFATY